MGASAGLALTGQLALPIEFSGQRSARIGAADAFVSWREREQAAAEGRAGGDALVAYGRALVARARLDLGAQAEGEAKTELAWFEARAAAGDATAVDRSLAQAELAHYGQLRAEAEIALAGAMADLRALTGITDAGDPPSEGAPPPQPHGTPSGLAAEQVASSSPGIQAFDREAAYWDRQTEVARAKRSAPLEVIVSGGQDEFGQIRIGGGLAWAFPFIRGNEGEIALALAETSRARADRDAVTRAVIELLRGLDERIARTRDAVAELDRTGIPAASGLVQATTAAFKAGKLELVRVLIARRDLALMRGRRLDLVEAGWRAYGELAAIGGGLP